MDNSCEPLIRRYTFSTLKWGGAFFICLGLFFLAPAVCPPAPPGTTIALLVGAIIGGLGVLLIWIGIQWREEWQMDEVGITYRQGGRVCAYLRLDEIGNLWVGNTGLILEGPADQSPIHIKVEVYKPFLERFRRLARTTVYRPGQPLQPLRDGPVEHGPEALPLIHRWPRRLWLDLVVVAVLAGGLSVLSAFLWLDPSFMRLANETPRDRERRELMKYIFPALPVGVVLLCIFGPIREFRVAADGLEIRHRVTARRYVWRDLSWVALGNQYSQMVLVICPRKGGTRQIHLGDKTLEFLNTILTVAARNGLDLTQVPANQLSKIEAFTHEVVDPPAGEPGVRQREGTVTLISSDGLLYIDPTQTPSTEPVLDHLTRKMAAAFRKAGPSGEHWCGIRECCCGAFSTSCDYRLPNGEKTNLLCVHYVAHHRSEVPADQLSKIGAFTHGEAEPAAEELQGPDLVLARARASIETRLGPRRLETWTCWGLDVDGLAQNLRGGRLPARQGLSPARGVAEDLLTLLCSIQPDSLTCVKAVVEQDHRDVREWGEQALCSSGWSRGLWVAPLVALIKQSKGMERRCAAMNLQLLGSAAAAAVPTLMEVAMTEVDDHDYQYDLSLALADVGKILGVSLLAQIPPRRGQVGACSSCNASGHCYCKRKGMADSDPCARCNGSGKCHVCNGTGRLRCLVRSSCDPTVSCPDHGRVNGKPPTR